MTRDRKLQEARDVRSTKLKPIAESAAEPPSSPLPNDVIWSPSGTTAVDSYEPLDLSTYESPVSAKTTALSLAASNLERRACSLAADAYDVEPDAFENVCPLPVG